jgi:hypothetical protein
MSEDLIERSAALDERIAGSSEIDDLVRYGHRNRVLIRILGAILMFDVLLSMGLGLVAFRADQAARQANSTQQQQRAACIAGNEARTGNRQLWHHVLDLPPSAPRTPAQQQQADEFSMYVDQLFAPRSC